MTELHGRPTAVELVTTVREFLDELLPLVHTSHAYKLRVATSALRIVERELNDPPASPTAAAALGGENDARLAAALRDDTVPAPDYSSAASALMADVTVRLQVSNPRYVERYEPDEFDDGSFS